MSIGKAKNILEKPTFLKIAHRASVLRDLLQKSMNTLGKEAGISNATADEWSDKQIEKPTRTVKAFLSHHKIRLEWWQTGEGEVFDKNGTYVELPTKGKDEKAYEILEKKVKALADYNEALQMENEELRLRLKKYGE